MSQTTAPKSEIRYAARIARTESSRGRRGEKGTWTIDLGIDGLSEERRAEISDRINQALNLEKGQKAGDGHFHGRCIAHDMSFDGATIFGLCEVARLLREPGGVDFGTELLANSMTFEVTPQEVEVAEARPRKLRQKVLQKVIPDRVKVGLLQVGWGAGAAAAVEYDRGIRQKHGDRSFVIVGKVDGLDAGTLDRVRVEARRAGMSEDAIKGGLGGETEFNFVVQVDQAGNAIGALLIFLRNMGRLFELLPATTSLKVDIRAAPRGLRRSPCGSGSGGWGPKAGRGSDAASSSTATGRTTTSP